MFFFSFLLYGGGLRGVLHERKDILIMRLLRALFAL